MSPVILVVEDDPAMALGLTRMLETAGYRVIAAKNGAEVAAIVRDKRPDLVLLDVMMPRKDGFQVVRELRAAGEGVPVVMLTAKGEAADKVLGLELGADDYVTKPFGVPELLARIKARLRRADGGAERIRSASFPGLEIDYERQSVVGLASQQALSSHEVRLLRALASCAGELVPRARLLADVWGDDSSVTDRVVDYHVVKLRRKLELATGEAEPRRILTMHGSGYKFVP
ncbi:MAG: response regulator transcription factor [Planctomycetota bacterium]